MAIIMYNRLINLKNLISTNNSAIGILYNTTQNLINTSRLCTNIIEDIESESDNTSARTKKKLSKAMRAYLQRAQEHDRFMKQEITEYEIGRRHLANIMGENAETFTQKDIDRSIQYLFPSGLYDWRARPLIRPPEEIFPDRKAAEFDESGRPYNPLFYTQNPNYYSVLHDLAAQMEALNQLEDQKLRKGVLPSPEEKAQLLGSSWLSKVDLEALFLEALLDKQYEYFVASFERLAHHPMSAHASEFLMKYRKAIIAQVQEGEIQPIEYGPDGRPFVKVTQCMRKSARGTVTVIGEGSGKITVNGEMITTHFDLQSREQIIFPLIFTGLAEQVDVEATVTGGGTTGQSGAIRWGIAWALRSFVDKKMLEKMKIAGLLTRDWRTRERKKPGQEGARRKFTWNKR